MLLGSAGRATLGGLISMRSQCSCCPATFSKRRTHFRTRNLHLGHFANLAAMALADQLGKDDKDVKMSQVQLVIGNTECGGHRYGDGLQQKSVRSDFNTLFYEIPEVQQQIATHRAVTIHVVHK